MPNTLTGLIPTLYEALNIVSREMVGGIVAVNRDSNAERAALNQTVRVPIVGAGTLEDATPAVTSPNSGDQTVGYVDLAITKSKVSPVRWNGEEQKVVGSSGTYNQILANQFAESMRTLVNAVEDDICIAAKIGASRAVGTAGTTPFGTANDLTDFATVLQILEENGAPQTDLQILLNSNSMANLRGKQSVLFKVNEAGSSDMLREGMTDRIQKMALRYSAGLKLHTKGTGAGYLTNSAALVAGNTTVPVDTGTGTVLAGDVVSFNGDTNKYVAGAALAGGNLTLNKPGLLGVVGDNQAVTVGNNYRPNIAFARTAIALATRFPAVPKGGDSADDSFELVDPISGLAFEVRVYKQYRQVRYEVGLAWGQVAVKPEHIALLLG